MHCFCWKYCQDQTAETSLLFPKDTLVVREEALFDTYKPMKKLMMFMFSSLISTERDGL